MSSRLETTSTPKSTSPIDWEYICTHCRRGFNTSMAHQITMVDDTAAELMCSWCKHTDIYEPPNMEDIERPPALVSHTVRHDSEGEALARGFFEGGAWLQYREAPDGWVYEEMFTPAGENVASFKAESERDDCNTPREYIRREMDRYETYTVRGVEVQRPHIAGVLHDTE